MQSDKKGQFHQYVLIFYDICSLFTSILLKKAIVLAVKLIHDNNSNIKITKNYLKKPFEFETSGTQIIFDGNYNDQTDGVAIGSSLGCVLANIYMGF